MAKDITKKKYLREPIDKVWQAISQSEQISQWFLEGTIQSEEGGKVQLKGKGKDITGEVLTSQEPINLAYSWVDPKLSYTTYVWWKLIEKDGKTLIELEHSGFKGFQGAFAALSYGSFWKRSFKDLEQFLNKTATSNPAEPGSN